MFQARYAHIALVGLLTGCILSPTQLAQLITEELGGTGRSVADLAPAPISDPNAPALDSPAVGQAPITVRLSNPTERDAECRVTMELAAQQVHFSIRRILAGSDWLVIGPDQADLVRIEATFLGQPPAAMDPQILRLGRDYAAGEVIHFVLALPPTEEDESAQEIPDEGDEGEGEKEAGNLTVRIEGLDEDIRVNPGTMVVFDVVTENASDDARIGAFADPDSDPRNGNESPIVDDAPAADRTTVGWDTAGTAPSTYAIYADLEDGTEFVRFGPAAGRVRVNAIPTLVITAPPDGLLLMVGAPLLIEWDGTDPDDNALVTIFLDTDMGFNGNEEILAANLSEDDPEARTIIVDTAGLAPASYYVGGLIDDGLASIVVYGPQLCMTDRLAGWLTPPQLAEGEITVVLGVPFDPNGLGGDPNFPANVSLGAAVDVSRDLDGDGLADLLLGDPLAVIDYGEDVGVVGVSFYHKQRRGIWPRELATDELLVHMIGEQDGGRAGHSVAFADPFEPASTAKADIVIGSPTLTRQSFEGRSYFLDGSQVPSLAGQPLFLSDIVPLELGSYVDGTLNDEAGSTLAAIGDLNADESGELAIGAPGPALAEVPGRVAVIYGGLGLPFGSLDDVGAGEGIPGFQLLGENAGDQAGFAVADAGVFNPAGITVELRGLLVGAPRAEVDTKIDAGKVYLTLFESGPSGGALLLADVGTPALLGHVFQGESSGDGAGTAIASVDANGDGRPDVLIGAPYFDNGRGRVYLIYNLAEQPLPATVPLAEVGNTIPGVRFDGPAPGDLLGRSVANAGDTDGDGAEDILIGAPFAEAGSGAAYLIYGGQSLAGSISLQELATCHLHGWALVGEHAGAQLGFAVSGGGDLDGNGLPDVGIGSPGFSLEGSSVGRAYLVFPSATPPAPPPELKYAEVLTHGGIAGAGGFAPIAVADDGPTGE